jgi:hypothetical protein
MPGQIGRLPRPGSFFSSVVLGSFPAEHRRFPRHVEATRDEAIGDVPRGVSFPFAGTSSHPRRHAFVDPHSPGCSGRLNGVTRDFTEALRGRNTVRVLARRTGSGKRKVHPEESSGGRHRSGTWSRQAWVRRGPVGSRRGRARSRSPWVRSNGRRPPGRGRSSPPGSEARVRRPESLGPNRTDFASRMRASDRSASRTADGRAACRSVESIGSGSMSESIIRASNCSGWSGFNRGLPDEMGHGGAGNGTPVATLCDGVRSDFHDLLLPGADHEPGPNRNVPFFLTTNRLSSRSTRRSSPRNADWLSRSQDAPNPA